MFRILFTSIVTLAILSTWSGGCNFEKPRMGSVLQEEDGNTQHTTSSVHEDTIGTANDDIHNTTANTGTHADSSSHAETDATIILGTPPSGIRPCSDDGQCGNADFYGDYRCHGGVCLDVSRPCTRDSDCADSNICTGIEQCENNRCYLGPRWECDDSNPRTGQSCNPSSGCVYWDIRKCTRDSDCAPGFICSMDSFDCTLDKVCSDDSECADGDACTVDRCSEGTCANEALICIDFDPDTLDTCAPSVGCVFTEGCSQNVDCNDWRTETRDECIEGSCSHTKVYVFVSVLSSNPSQQGDRVDYYVNNGYNDEAIALSDALPSQLWLPYPAICTAGLQIDIYSPSDGCSSYELEGIDVWLELTELTYTLIPDECGMRIYVAPDQFGCSTYPATP